MKKIGVLYGQENAFPAALIEKINSMKVPGIVAEAVMVDLVKQGMTSEYAVIIDRISHDVPFYRSYLKTVALSGTAVINNPFWWSADEKFINNSIAMQLGIPVPKTYLLPSNQMPAETNANSFRNLKFPLDWDKIAKDIKFPAYIKPHAGGGWKHVYRVENLNDLWNKHNLTGDLVMMVQEEIVFESYYRCYCVGGKYVHIMPYEPRNPHDQRYIQQDPKASSALLDTIRDYTLRLNQALGYEFNSVEFAVRKGVPYAIDFCNPAPDADLHSVGKENFNWVVKHMALYAVEKALAQTAGNDNLMWGATLTNAVMQHQTAASGVSSPVKRGPKAKNTVKLAAIDAAPKRRGRPAKEKVAVAADATPKRRGRPAKPKAETAEMTTAPKRRGRPAKEKVAVAADATPKRRGRPAKPKAESADMATAPKRRGRPAKEKVAVAADATPKRRGRPAKPKAETAETATEPKRRGRPAKPKAETAETATEPKRRGRPAKEKVAVAADTTPKRRGRPAKPKAETAETATEPKRRGRPAKATASTEEVKAPKTRGRKPKAAKVAAVKKPKKAKMAITSGKKDEKVKSKRGRKPKANKVVKPKRVKIEKPLGDLMGIDAVLASEKLNKL